MQPKEQLVSRAETIVNGRIGSLPLRIAEAAAKTQDEVLVDAQRSAARAQSIGFALGVEGPHLPSMIAWSFAMYALSSSLNPM